MIIIIIRVDYIFAQNTTQNPIDRSNNALNSVISDFGPRYVNSATASKFHFGLDYGLSRVGLQPAYTVESGSIDVLPLTASDIAYIKVGAWRYMHCDYGVTSDSLWELTLDGIHPVLVIKSDQTTISHVYVLSNYPNTTFRSVNVEKTIGLGEIIFRPNTLNHLHLDRGNKIFTNVLQFLPRSDVNSPVTTLNLKYNNNGTATVFPSNIIYGNIIVESEVNYENEKDLDNVVLQLGDKGVFSDIFAWHYTGANHLTYTSYSTGTSTVPQYVTHQIGVLGTIRNNPNEGIFPRDGAGLDIFKYHFNSKETIAGSTNPYNERR